MIRYLKLLKYVFSKKTKGPIQLIHFVTSKCNSRCKHCFYWKNLNQNNDLTLADIGRITKTLPELYYLLISGGEPFLRNDFVDIIRCYYENTPVINVAIPTNGLLTEKIRRDCIEILEKCPDLQLNIIISLDGPEKTHNEIRGVPNCFEIALRTFSELKKLKRRYSRLKLSIVSTLMSINQDKMIDFYKYVKKELKPDVFIVILIRSTPQNLRLKEVDLNYFKEILKLELKSLKSKNLRDKVRNFIHKTRIKLIIDTIKKKKYILPCYAGSLMGVMSEDGKIYPCELLSKSIGNIKDFNYDFREAWKSKAAEDCRKFICKSKCFCTHECFLRLNILFNLRYLLKRLFR